MPDLTVWNCNRVAFTRLLAAVKACGVSDGLFSAIRVVFGLDIEQVKDILRRAEEDWEEIVAQEGRDEIESYRSRAAENHEEEGSLEIDDNAQVSEAEGGAWVEAWVWVPKE
jgi:hypothetical protein